MVLPNESTQTYNLKKMTYNGDRITSNTWFPPLPPMCSMTFFERDITRDRISLLERVVDLGYILRRELILFLLVPQILGKHTINYFQIVKVMKCMECTLVFSKKWRYRDDGHPELKTDTRWILKMFQHS